MSDAKSIPSILQEFQADLAQATSSTLLEAVKVKFLGRKGTLQQLMQQLKEVAPEQRPEVGKQINALKEEITQQLQQAEERLIGKEEALQLQAEQLDVTLPGASRFAGQEHLITQSLAQMLQILIEMGFSVQYGPDIDTEYYNFDALNLPPDHPARDMQDTFYIGPNLLLRTHTSNIQARLMEKQPPPIRAVTPGKAYRNEAISARSHVFFHQLEAFYVDQGVNFADLLYTTKRFLSRFFEKEIAVRFRPSFFPFVEPGMEVDISCLNCQGKGCALCKEAGWLEIGGAGMIHPEVLSNGGIDPEQYTGYAWGLGVERLVMLKHGIRDIRLFTENHLRFLRQFHG